MHFPFMSPHVIKKYLIGHINSRRSTPVFILRYPLSLFYTIIDATKQCPKVNELVSAGSPGSTLIETSLIKVIPFGKKLSK